MTANHQESSNSSSKKQWDRDKNVIYVHEFEQLKGKVSQHQHAKDNGISRTTLQYWLERKRSLDVDSELINFFESPIGLAFLHRLVNAAHFEFSKNDTASIRSICNFFKLSGLSQFVASSYGAQQKVSIDMDDLIIQFAGSERKRLSADMPLKMIILCEDETFHPQVCLVAIEAISNFILLEQYATDRKADTWTACIESALSGLPVKAIQCTSDEASGLINHAKVALKVHHSSDLFHVAYEVGKGTSVALASLIKHNEKEVQKAEEKVKQAEEYRAIYESNKNTPVGWQPAFDKRVAEAKSERGEAQKLLEQAQEKQEIVRTARVEIGQAYHPYDPITGVKQEANKVGEELEKCFKKIREAIESLSDKCKKHIDKAYRVVANMRATIAFFFLTINSYVENLNFSQEVKQILHESLIPGFYLQIAARKEKDSKRKKMILKKSEELLSILYERKGVLSDYSEAQLCFLEKSAKECAHLFQRSSSCVEGRNAQLSLIHHGLHRLSNRKLQALTAIHNYYIKRPDGTTAAERFFEKKPYDMFEWLLDHMELPARPRNVLKKAI